MAAAAFINLACLLQARTSGGNACAGLVSTNEGEAPRFAGASAGSEVEISDVTLLVADLILQPQAPGLASPLVQGLSLPLFGVAPPGGPGASASSAPTLSLNRTHLVLPTDRCASLITALCSSWSHTVDVQARGLERKRCARETPQGGWRRWLSGCRLHRPLLVFRPC